MIADFEKKKKKKKKKKGAVLIDFTLQNNWEPRIIG